MRLLKMLLLSPFVTIMAVWQALVMFVCIFIMVWEMLRKIDDKYGDYND